MTFFRSRPKEKKGTGTTSPPLPSSQDQLQPPSPPPAVISVEPDLTPPAVPSPPVPASAASPKAALSSPKSAKGAPANNDRASANSSPLAVSTPPQATQALQTPQKAQAVEEDLEQSVRASLRYPSLAGHLMPPTPSPASPHLSPTKPQSRSGAVSVTRVSKSSFSLKHAKESGLFGRDVGREGEAGNSSSFSSAKKSVGPQNDEAAPIVDESSGLLPALELYGSAHQPSKGPFRTPSPARGLPTVAAASGGGGGAGGTASGGSGQGQSRGSYFSQHFPAPAPQLFVPNAHTAFSFKDDGDAPPSAIRASVASANKLYGAAPLGLKRVLARVEKKRRQVSLRGGSGSGLVTSSAPHSPGGGAGTSVFAGGRPGTDLKKRDGTIVMAPLSPPPLHVGRRDQVLLRPQLTVSGLKEERTMRLEAIVEEKDRAIEALKSEIVSLRAVKRGLEREVDAVTSDRSGLPQRVAALAEEVKTEREKQRQLALELKVIETERQRKQDAVIALTLALKSSRKQLVEAHQAIVVLQRRENEREKTAAQQAAIIEERGDSSTSESSSSSEAQAQPRKTKPPTLLTAALSNPEPSDEELLEEAMRFFMSTKKGDLGLTGASAGSDESRSSRKKKAAVPTQPPRPSASLYYNQQQQRPGFPYLQPPLSPSQYHGGPVPMPIYSPTGSPSFRLSPSAPPFQQPRVTSPSPTRTGGGAQGGGGGDVSARVSYAQGPSRRISSSAASVSPSPSHLIVEEAVRKAKEEWLREKTQMMLKMRQAQGKDNLRLSRSLGVVKKAAPQQQQAEMVAAPAAGSKRKALDRSSNNNNEEGSKRSSWSPAAALKALKTPPVPLTGTLMGSFAPQPPSARGSEIKTKRKVPGPFVSSRRVVEVSKPSPMPAEIIRSQGTGIGVAGQKTKTARSNTNASGGSPVTTSTARGTQRGRKLDIRPAAAMARVPLEEEAPEAEPLLTSSPGKDGASGGSPGVFHLTSAGIAGAAPPTPLPSPVKSLDFSALHGAKRGPGPSSSSSSSSSLPKAEAEAGGSAAGEGGSSPLPIPPASPHSPPHHVAAEEALGASGLEAGAEEILEDEGEESPLPAAPVAPAASVPTPTPPPPPPAPLLTEEEQLEEEEEERILQGTLGLGEPAKSLFICLCSRYR